jgi:hypothetical protein
MNFLAKLSVAYTSLNSRFVSRARGTPNIKAADQIPRDERDDSGKVFLCP